MRVADSRNGPQVSKLCDQDETILKWYNKHGGKPKGVRRTRVAPLRVQHSDAKLIIKTAKSQPSNGSTVLKERSRQLRDKRRRMHHAHNGPEKARRRRVSCQRGTADLALSTEAARARANAAGSEVENDTALRAASAASAAVETHRQAPTAEEMEAMRLRNKIMAGSSSILHTMGKPATSPRVFLRGRSASGECQLSRADFCRTNYAYAVRVQLCPCHAH